MGTETISGRVPFAIQYVASGDICFPDKDWPRWIKIICNPDEDDDYPNFYFGKWHWSPDGPCIEHDDLYLMPIMNGKYCVYEVNESQYSAGGAMELTICALDRESLEKFAHDFQLKKSDIQENVKLYQTM
jgi:hypothetical protein